jgi:hypothetical protein
MNEGKPLRAAEMIGHENRRFAWRGSIGLSRRKGDGRITELRNEGFREHPVPDVPHPEEYALETARKSYPYFDYFAVTIEKDPDDLPPNVLMRVFNPEIVPLPIHRLLGVLNEDRTTAGVSAERGPRRGVYRGGVSTRRPVSNDSMAA